MIQMNKEEKVGIDEATTGLDKSIGGYAVRRVVLDSVGDKSCDHPYAFRILIDSAWTNLYFSHLR